MYLKAHKVVPQGYFSFIILYDYQLSLNFHKFVIVYICWDTPSENTEPISI